MAKVACIVSLKPPRDWCKDSHCDEKPYRIVDVSHLLKRPKESVSTSLSNLVSLRRLLSHGKLAISIRAASDWVAKGLAHIGVGSQLGLGWDSVNAGSQHTAHSGNVEHFHFNSPVNVNFQRRLQRKLVNGN